MHDALEIEPVDAEVLEEITLTVNLMIAAATTRGHLNTPSIDRVLGVNPPGAEEGGVTCARSSDVPRG